MAERCWFHYVNIAGRYCVGGDCGSQTVNRKCRFGGAFCFGTRIDPWTCKKEKMNMKKNKFLDLLTSVDVLNTLNGGISEAQIAYHQEENGREIRVYIPGVDMKTVQVEVHNNTLSVFYFIPVVSDGKPIQMPQLIYNKVVPYFIEIGKISSHSEDRELVVTLPFNKLANGYHRKIQLDEE